MEETNTKLIITHKLDIQSNMEELATKIQTDIKEKYSLTVTDETVTDTKKVMAEINKEKDEFKKKYKEFKNLVLEPFAPLDTKAKEIEGYFDTARTALDAQVKKFEEVKREQAKTACTEYTKEQCELKGINFEAITISDLFNKLGSVTEKGNISGTAKKEIDQRIAIVENEVLKAKLEAEEKAKRDREIAETARLEAEEKAKQREIGLLAQAEIDKQEAVRVAIQETKENKPTTEENEQIFVEKVIEKSETIKQAIEPADYFVNPKTQETKEITFKVTATQYQLELLSDFLSDNEIEFEQIKDLALCG